MLGHVPETTPSPSAATVLDAKPAVDRYLTRADNSFKPEAVRQAMALYVAAIGAWRTSFSAAVDVNSFAVPAMQVCPIAASFLTDTFQWIKDDRETRAGILIGRSPGR